MKIEIFRTSRHAWTPAWPLGRDRMVATMLALVGGVAFIGRWGVAEGRARAALGIGGLLLMLAGFAISIARRKRA